MKKKLFLSAGMAAFFTLLPVIFVLGRIGGVENWEGIPPAGITDSLYYYARMHEVADGYPLIGNPYAYEYRDSYSPAFIVPDIIAAIPLLVGLPWAAVMVVNIFVWSWIFLLLTLTLLGRLGVREHWAIPITILTYVCAYSFMLRPTIMQIVYPVLGFFLIAYFSFLHNPLSRRQKILLGVASATTFYVYNFLSLVVFLACLLLLVWFIVRKQYQELRALIQVGLYTALLLVPFAVWSFLQMQGPLYDETLVRLGLVKTRIPVVEAFFYGRWVVFGLIAYALLLVSVTKQYRERLTKLAIFWFTVGFAFLIGLSFNTILGVDITFAIHVARLIVPWLALFLGVLFYEWIVAHAQVVRTRWWVYALAGMCILLTTVGVVKNIERGIGFLDSDNRQINFKETQAYARPLAWLRDNAPHESVIWSTLSFGSYVPIMTSHYTLFHNAAGLQTIPGSEMEERYLLWRSLQDTSLQDLRDEYGHYAGAGSETEQPLAFNNQVRFCMLISKIVERSCPSFVDYASLRGEAYFQNLFETYKTIRDNRSALLRKYSVDYLVVDTLYDQYELPFATSTSVYTDGRFFIYPVTAIEE